MRLTVRLFALVLVPLLLPQRVVAQAALNTAFGWSHQFSTFVAYGGGSTGHPYADGALHSAQYSFAGIGSPSTYTEGTGSGQASYGYLTGSARAHSDAGAHSIWYLAGNAFTTDIYFRDVITVVSGGQLDFSMMLGSAHSLSAGAVNSGCGVFTVSLDQCARAESRLTIGLSASAYRQLGHSIASSPSATSSTSTGMINVNAGDVLEFVGQFSVGAASCESPSTPCVAYTGTGTNADASGWAQYYIDAYGGAGYIAESGTQYATSVVATPEPASVLLMATGLIGLAAVVRRRGLCV